MDYLGWFIRTLLGPALTLYFGEQGQEKWDEYNAAVDEQIALGTDQATARITKLMDMIADDPNTNAARTILEQMKLNPPQKALREVGESKKAHEERRNAVLGAFDEMAGTALAQGERDTAGFLKGLDTKTAELGAKYATDEADVMGLLDTVGNQGTKDIQKEFSTERAETLADLTSRGLGGQGVAGSLSHGLVTREADALARHNEQIAAMKSGALAQQRAGARGFDQYGFGLTSAYGNEGIGRGLNARLGYANTRLGADQGMSIEELAARQTALDRAFGLSYETGNNLADFEGGLGEEGRGLYADASGDYLDFIQGITHVPPDTSFIDPLAYSSGQGFAR